MLPYSGRSSPRTKTFATAAELADADAIKTLVATALTAQSYSGAALNGALANPGPAVFDPPRFVSVTTTTDAATYNTTDPIVVTGTRNGEVVTESLVLTQAGGNETVIGDQPFDTVTQIDIPAQLTVNGEFTFGVSGVAERKPNQPYRQVRAIGAGNLHVGYAGGVEDTFAMADGEKDPILAERIYASGTTCGVKLYD